MIQIPNDRDRKRGESMFEYIQFEMERDVAILTLNNPKKLNAINFQMMDEMHQALDLLETNGARALVIWGGEKVFGAGMDITRDKSAEKVKPTDNVVARKLHTLYNRIESLPIAVIAAVSGYALGGGFELSLACDIRIFSETAKVGLPELNLGTIPCGGGTQRLPRLVGSGKALELILTCDKITAEEAYRLGIANRVVPVEELWNEAMTLAHRLAAQAPLAVEMAKHAVYAGLETDLTTGLFIEARDSAPLKYTEDYAEGVAAFREKRKPQFRGA